MGERDPLPSSVDSRLLDRLLPSVNPCLLDPLPPLVDPRMLDQPPPLVDPRLLNGSCGRVCVAPSADIYAPRPFTQTHFPSPCRPHSIATAQHISKPTNYQTPSVAYYHAAPDTPIHTHCAPTPTVPAFCIRRPSRAPGSPSRLSPPQRPDLGSLTEQVAGPASLLHQRARSLFPDEDATVVVSTDRR